MSKITIDAAVVQQAIEALYAGKKLVAESKWLKDMQASCADALRAAIKQATKCSEHPDAPHGFNRNASHSEGRYVCECEGWSPDDGQEPVDGVVMREGLPTLVRKSDVKPTDGRLYTHTAPAHELTPIPIESSDEAAAAIKDVLKEYDYPANPTNAARAGWRAARIYKSAQPVQEPDRTGTVYYKNDKCKAKTAESPDCICWTPEHSVQEPVAKVVRNEAAKLSHIQRQKND
jgi:hypothetical protein